MPVDERTFAAAIADGSQNISVTTLICHSVMPQWKNMSMGLHFATISGYTTVTPTSLS